MTTGELFLAADGKLDDQRRRLELVAHLLHDALELGAHAVHLVDERDAWDAILVGLAPHSFRLRLDAADRAKHGDRAVEDAQAALHLNGEIDVARGVDDVDAVVAPETGSCGRSYGYAALLLLHHPVHGGGAFMHLTDLVVDARIIEHPLRGGGLAGIDMSHDADIAHPFYWGLTSHPKISIVTSDSGQTPCWRPPSDEYPRAS